MKGSREEDAAVVGEHDLFLAEVGDAEHEDVRESLALGVDRVGPSAAVETEHLPVHEVRRPSVVGELLGRLRHGECELVEVGHRRHGGTLPELALQRVATNAAIASANSFRLVCQA